MVPARAFPGFEDPAQHVSITIEELSAQSYGQVARAFNPETLRLQGTEERNREDISLSDGRALLVTGRPASGTPAMTKWAMLALLGDVTAVVIALVPDAAARTYPDAILRAAFASLVVRPKLPAADLMAILPYRLDELAGFHLLQASPDGVAQLTAGPLDTPLPVEQPFLLVAPHAGDAPDADARAAVAIQDFHRMSGFGRTKVTSTSALRLGGLFGYEVAGTTMDPKAEIELSLVQWLEFGQSNYLQIYGVARSDLWPSVLPRMRAIRDGLRLK